MLMGADLGRPLHRLVDPAGSRSAGCLWGAVLCVESRGVPVLPGGDLL